VSLPKAGLSWRPPITGVSDDFWPLCWRWRRVGVVEGA
jgi:hypothetical protein